MEEEEDLTYGQKVEQTYNLIGDKLKDNPLGYLATGLGFSAGGANPKVIGSAAEGRMIKQGTANLMNPQYRDLLGKSKGTIGKNVMKAGGIPLTAALIAGDTVLSEAQRREGAMQRMSDIEGSQMQKAGGNLAERLRRLNLIEEQKAFDEDRPKFGGEEGITMGNLDEYLAANQNFSGIGNVQLPGEEPRVAPVAQQTATNPTMEGVDYSSAFQGSQGELAQGIRRSSPIDIYTDYLGNLAKQGVSADERTAIASQMLAPFLRAGEAKEKAQQDKPSADKENTSEASVADNNQLSIGDYRNILRAQGVGGSAQLSLAKQMMNEAQTGKSKAALNTELIRAQIAKANQQKAPRAPTSPEFTMGVVNQMSQLQNKINQGMQLNDQEQMIYNSGNAFLQLQSKGDFGFESPFQMPNQDVADATVLPSADDPEGKALIEQVMTRNPGKSKEDVTAKLRSANKLS